MTSTTPTNIKNNETNNNNDNESKSKIKPYPYKIQSVEENITKELLGAFTGQKKKFLQISPKKWFLCSGFEGQVHEFYNFAVRPSDVFIITFPRSVLFAPYWEHIKEGWNRRHEENVLFLFYEDLKKNLRPSIKKLSSFLEQSYSEEEYDILEDYVNIENFRNNKAVNSDEDKDLGVMTEAATSFVRNGVVGGWKSYFTDQLNAEADRWIEENLDTCDLIFPS
ncbi:unnamed protein product [Diabrotica balteata]|uniref:Sulfotransferase domain-containing protein n=1 Tax=Diabrotica balteata TaxID=107213 RepID=A0A9N9SPJ2_DIABA|nr:unnamed protein product [Diabrotica balteata]